MSYGLRIKDALSNIILDISETITRFRWSSEVAAGASSNTTLADISGKSSVEVSIALSSVYNDAPHLISRSGTTITWTADSGAYSNSCASLLFLFLYD